MSEVYAEVTNDGDPASALAEADNAAQAAEKTDDFWDLYNFYTANADVVAPCHWAGGAVMTLREAVPLISVSWTSENAPLIFADLITFVGNRVEQSDQANEEPEEQAQENDEKEQEAQKSEDKEIEESQKNDQVDAEQPPAPEAATERPTETDSSSLPPATAQTETGSIKKADAVQQSPPDARHDQAAKPIAKPKQPAKTAQRPEVKPAVKAKTPAGGAEVAISKPANKANAPKKPMPEKIQKSADSAIDSQIEPPKLTEPEPVAPLKTFDERLVKPKLAKTTAKDESKSPPKVARRIDAPAKSRPAASREVRPPAKPLEIVNEVIEPETAKRPVENAEAPSQSTPDSIDPVYRPDRLDALENLEELEVSRESALIIEEEDLFVSSEALDFVELSTADNAEVIIFARATEDLVEQPAQPTEPEVEISLPPEHIADNLNTLVELVEQAEPQKLQESDVIAAQIVEASLSLDESENGAPIDELAVEAELEELFVNLFEILEMDYSQELVEDLSRMTIRLHREGELQKLKNDQPETGAPQGVGTHELIKLLVIGLSDINKAKNKIAEIGSRALRLTFESLAA